MGLSKIFMDLTVLLYTVLFLFLLLDKLKEDKVMGLANTGM